VGDIVVGIGSNEVTDMMSYMKALGAFNKGDTAPVKILRQGQPLEKQVTF
jgi:S1-C subfamily serine protease